MSEPFCSAGISSLLEWRVRFMLVCLSSSSVRLSEGGIGEALCRRVKLDAGGAIRRGFLK